MQTKYAQIIFFQEHRAEEALRILDEQGKEAAMDFLAQWDCGRECEMDCRDTDGSGSHDRRFERGDYILSWVPGLYIGLQRRFEVKSA